MNCDVLFDGDAFKVNKLGIDKWKWYVTFQNQQFVIYLYKLLAIPHSIHILNDVAEFFSVGK